MLFNFLNILISSFKVIFTNLKHYLLYMYTVYYIIYCIEQVYSFFFKTTIIWIELNVMCLLDFDGTVLYSTSLYPGQI